MVRDLPLLLFKTPFVTFNFDSLVYTPIEAFFLKRCLCSFGSGIVATIVFVSLACPHVLRALHSNFWYCSLLLIGEKAGAPSNAFSTPSTTPIVLVVAGCLHTCTRQIEMKIKGRASHAYHQNIDNTVGPRKPTDPDFPWIALQNHTGYYLKKKGTLSPTQIGERLIALVKNHQSKEVAFAACAESLRVHYPKTPLR